MDPDEPTHDVANSHAPAQGSAALGRAARPWGAASELGARARELGELEDRAARLDARLSGLRAELRTFESAYRTAVAPRYKELDRLEAEIAEALAAVAPDDLDLREKARAARARAEETAEAADEDAMATRGGGCGVPSVGLKRLYRRVAFEMHPDRCGDAREAAHRHELMVEANRAYRDGDEGALELLLADLDLADEAAPSSLELRSILARIARERRRIALLERELAEVEAGELHSLWVAFASAARQGRDLFREKLDELDRRLSRMRARLDVLVAMG